MGIITVCVFPHGCYKPRHIDWVAVFAEIAQPLRVPGCDPRLAGPPRPGKRRIENGRASSGRGNRDQRLAAALAERIGHRQLGDPLLKDCRMATERPEWRRVDWIRHDTYG